MPAPLIVSSKTFPAARFTRDGVWNVERFGVGVPMRVLGYDASRIRFESPTFDGEVLPRIRRLRILTTVRLLGPPFTSVVTARRADWEVPAPWMTDIVDRASVHSATKGEGALLCEWTFDIRVPLDIVTAAQQLNVWWDMPGGFRPDDPRAYVLAFATQGQPMPRFE